MASKALVWIDRDRSFFEQGVGLGYLAKSRALLDMVGQLALDGAVVPQTATSEAIQRARVYMARGQAYFSVGTEMSDLTEAMIHDLNECLGGGLVKR